MSQRQTRQQEVKIVLPGFHIMLDIYYSINDIPSNFKFTDRKIINILIEKNLIEEKLKGMISILVLTPTGREVMGLEDELTKNRIFTEKYLQYLILRILDNYADDPEYITECLGTDYTAMLNVLTEEGYIIPNPEITRYIIQNKGYEFYEELFMNLPNIEIYTDNEEYLQQVGFGSQHATDENKTVSAKKTVNRDLDIEQHAQISANLREAKQIFKNEGDKDLLRLMLLHSTRRVGEYQDFIIREFDIPIQELLADKTIYKVRQSYQLRNQVILDNHIVTRLKYKMPTVVKLVGRPCPRVFKSGKKMGLVCMKPIRAKGCCDYHYRQNKTIGFRY